MTKPPPGAQSSAERRFYERSYLRSVESGAGAAAPMDAALHPSDRYFHVFRHLGTYRPQHCVELGIGGPRYLPALSALSGRLTLVDVLDRTGGFRAPNVSFLEHNLNDALPLEAACADAVIALMVIEHLFDPFHAFAEVARVLRPGGWLYLNLPLVTSIRNRLRLLMGILPNTSRPGWYELREWDGGHLHYFTLPLVRRLLGENGFDPAAVLPVGRLLWLKRLRPQLFCGEITIIARRS